MYCVQYIAEYIYCAQYIYFIRTAGARDYRIHVLSRIHILRQDSWHERPRSTYTVRSTYTLSGKLVREVAEYMYCAEYIYCIMTAGMRGCAVHILRMNGKY
jgi:hypothetical protein